MNLSEIWFANYFLFPILEYSTKLRTGAVSWKWVDKAERRTTEKGKSEANPHPDAELVVELLEHVFITLTSLSRDLVDVECVHEMKYNFD